MLGIQTILEIVFKICDNVWNILDFQKYGILKSCFDQTTLLAQIIHNVLYPSQIMKEQHRSPKQYRKYQSLSGLLKTCNSQHVEKTLNPGPIQLHFEETSQNPRWLGYKLHT